MTPPVIGLWSPAPGCGKTTVAELIQQLDPSAQVLPFAGSLKLMLRPLLYAAGYRDHEINRALYTAEGKQERLYFIPGMPTPRDLMQTLGTEWGRFRIDHNLWIGIWRAQVRDSARRLIIADDVRFPNEAEAVRAVGGQLWCIRSPFAVTTAEHISEGQLGDQPFDVIINNSGTIDDLKIAVQHALFQ